MLTLSAAAVRTGTDGAAHVLVVADGVARRKDIETGADNGVRFAVLNGLADDDLVIVGGNVQDGSAVRVVIPGDRR